jgi:hypothetical protein
MKPEEIRDDIPEDVREALAEFWSEYETDLAADTRKLRAVTRKRPRTVVIPRAEIPAPLTEVPESGCVWVPQVPGYAKAGPFRCGGPDARRAVDNDIAYATEADAQRALDAMMAREPVKEEAKADSLSDFIPWAYLDPEWQWAAMDDDGCWYVYEREPEANSAQAWLVGEDGDCRDLPIPDGAPVYWTETKVRRPEGV